MEEQVKRPAAAQCKIGSSLLAETTEDSAKEEPVIQSHPKEGPDDYEDSPQLENPGWNEQRFGGSVDRDAAIARVATAKRGSMIKAWEESEKTKAENKARKKFSVILAWENSRKAKVEAKLRQIEEKLEKEKAEYGERMKNKIAMIHKEAEEKRALVEAKRDEDLLKMEEIAAKCRATGAAPKKIWSCFGP